MNSVAPPSVGSLAQRVTAAPLLGVADGACARVDDWLAETAGTPAGKALARLFAAHPVLGALAMGLAEGSPYLWELARAEPERLAGLLESEPERRFDDILTEASRAIAA